MVSSWGQDVDWWMLKVSWYLGWVWNLVHHYVIMFHISCHKSLQENDSWIGSQNTHARIVYASFALDHPWQAMQTAFFANMSLCAIFVKGILIFIYIVGNTHKENAHHILTSINLKLNMRDLFGMQGCCCDELSCICTKLRLLEMQEVCHSSHLGMLIKVLIYVNYSLWKLERIHQCPLFVWYQGDTWRHSINKRRQRIKALDLHLRKSPEPHNYIK